MASRTFAQAMTDALLFCLETIPNFSMVGAEIFGLGPHAKEVERIKSRFDARLRCPPISEAATAALGIGAAMAGERVFVDIGSPAAALLALTQIVNEAGNAHYMSGGQIKVPVVFHMMHGLRGSGAAQHSHSPQAMLWNAPGIEIVLPSGPRDVKGLMLSAVKSDNPTVVLTHGRLLGLEENVPDDSLEIPFGQAEVKRQGDQVTVVATSLTVQVALEAGRELSREGIEIEVIDPRTLVPLDTRTIIDSVAKTGRLVVADETYLSCGVASEIAAIMAEQAFVHLKAPIQRVARPNVPVPAGPNLEALIAPSAEKIAAAVRAVLA